MPPSQSAARTCETTGLRLRPSRGQRAWRIAKATYGGLNPQQRPAGGDRREWNRYDVPLFKTAYASLDAKGAYAESLAHFRPSPLGAVTLGDFFDDEPDPTTPVSNVVEQEWGERNFMPPGAVPAGWRDDRLMYQLTLPVTGWFVDIRHSASIASIARQRGQQLQKAFGVEHLTDSDLTGQNRHLTTSVAEWIHGLVLDDGSQPHGLIYASKHGADWLLCCVWLRALHDGKTVDSEPTATDDGNTINGCPQNRALQYVADLFSLTCH